MRRTWLVVREVGLACDLGAGPDGGGFGCVFDIRKHPLIANNAAFSGVTNRRSPIVLGTSQDMYNEGVLGADGAIAVLDVLDALNASTEGRIPSLDDVRKSYIEGCVDIPAGNWCVDGGIAG